MIFFIFQYLSNALGNIDTRYTSKWPKTVVTEIGSGDFICIQTSKWPKYFFLSFWAILRF